MADALVPLSDASESLPEAPVSTGSRAIRQSRMGKPLRLALQFIAKVGEEQIKQVPVVGPFAAATVDLIGKLAEDEEKKPDAELLQRIAEESEQNRYLLSALVETAYQGIVQQQIEATTPEDIAALKELALVGYLLRVEKTCGSVSRRGIGRTGRNESIADLPLSEVYVVPNLKSERDEHWIRAGRDLERLDQGYTSPDERVSLLGGFEEHRRRHWKTEKAEETLPLDQVLEQSRRAIVVGGPGTGKTTLLRYVARRFAADEGAIESVVPCLLSLAAFEDWRCESGKITLLEYLQFKLTQEGGEVLWEAFVEELSAGRVIVLLDGLDEIPEKARRESAAEAVRQFLSAPFCGRCIVTSRPYGYEPIGTPDGGEAPTRYDMLPFTPAQIEEFLQKWFTILRSKNISDENADRVITEIRRHESTKELASNPLLLVIMTILCWEERELPKDRVVLYERIINLLADNWNKLRREEIDARSVQNELPVASLIDVLARVAAWMHENFRYVKRGKLERKLAEILQDKKQSNPEELAKTYLDAAAKRAGILEEIADGYFAFWHPTFEEYLTARHFTSRGVDTTAALMPYRHSPRYQEVLYLTIGDLSKRLGVSEDADALVRSLWHEKPDEWEPIVHRNLLLAIDCICDNSGLTASFAAEVLRAFLPIVRENPGDAYAKSLGKFSRTFPELAKAEPWLIDELLLLVDSNINIDDSVYRFILNASNIDGRCKNIWDEIVFEIEKDISIETNNIVRRFYNIGGEIQRKYCIEKWYYLFNNTNKNFCSFFGENLLRYDSGDMKYKVEDSMMKFLENENANKNAINFYCDVLLTHGSKNLKKELMSIIKKTVVNEHEDRKISYGANLLIYGNQEDEKVAVSILLPIMYSGNENRRIWASEILLRCNDLIVNRQVIENFILLLHSDKESVRLSSAKRLLQYGTEVDKNIAIECMLLLVDSDNENIFLESIGILLENKINDKKEIINKIISNLDIKNEVIFCKLNYILLKYGDPIEKNIACRNILKLIESTNDEVRSNSVRNLLEHGDDETKQVAVEIWRNRLKTAKGEMAAELKTNLLKYLEQVEDQKSRGTG